MHIGGFFITPIPGVTTELVLRLWNMDHQDSRLIIEYVNCFLKRFRDVSNQTQFHHNIPFQVQTIHTAGLLANRQIRENPLR